MPAYAGPPISAFQGQIRGSSTLLRDHISKEMNELNLERCRCIPKLAPGADWRVLQEIIEQHPERTLYKVRSCKCVATRRCSSWCPLLACSAQSLKEHRICYRFRQNILDLIANNATKWCTVLQPCQWQIPILDAPLESEE